MRTDAEADEIHLRVPALPAMAAVVDVTVRVLGARAHLVDADLRAIRRDVSDAFTALVDASDARPVDVQVLVRRGSLQVDLVGATGARRVIAPA